MIGEVKHDKRGKLEKGWSRGGGHLREKRDMRGRLEKERSAGESLPPFNETGKPGGAKEPTLGSCRLLVVRSREPPFGRSP
jgi:hypothetical protein